MTEGQKAFAEELEDVAVEVLRKERHGLVKAEREWIIEELKKRATANASKGMRSARITMIEIMGREANKGLKVDGEDMRLMRELSALKFRVEFVQTFQRYMEKHLKCEKCRSWCFWSLICFGIAYFCGPCPDCYVSHAYYEVAF